MRAAALQPALVDVADQEVGTALVAALADLAEQLLDRDARLFGPAFAEVVTVGVLAPHGGNRGMMMPDQGFGEVAVRLTGTPENWQSAHVALSLGVYEVL